MRCGLKGTNKPQKRHRGFELLLLLLTDLTHQAGMALERFLSFNYDGTAQKFALSPPTASGYIVSRSDTPGFRSCATIILGTNQLQGESLLLPV